MKKNVIGTIILAIYFVAINFNVSAQCVQCDENSSASGNYSSVIGMSTLATSDGAFAGGYGSEANGSLSFAFGNQVIAGSTNSVAIGRFLETTASPAMVFGTGASLTDKLINGISNSLMIGFNSNKPTLFVGISDGVNYTGKVGIGDVTNPQAKLHIKADDGEQAALFIEPNVFSTTHDAELWMGTSEYGLRATAGKMYFNTGGNYIFNDGNIGIGVINPKAEVHVKNGDIYIEDIDRGIIMKSPDGQCWRGTLDNNGNMNFTQVDCPETLTKSDDESLNYNAILLYPNPTGDKVFIKINKKELNAVQIDICDNTGKHIKTTPVINKEYYIDLSDYESGLYILNIKNAKGEVLKSGKIIKQ